MPMKCPICKTEKIDNFICHYCRNVYDRAFLKKGFEENRKERKMKYLKHEKDIDKKIENPYVILLKISSTIAIISLFGFLQCVVNSKPTAQDSIKSMFPNFNLDVCGIIFAFVGVGLLMLSIFFLIGKDNWNEKFEKKHKMTYPNKEKNDDAIDSYILICVTISIIASLFLFLLSEICLPEFHSATIHDAISCYEIRGKKIEVSGRIVSVLEPSYVDRRLEKNYFIKRKKYQILRYFISLKTRGLSFL